MTRQVNRLAAMLLASVALGAAVPAPQTAWVGSWATSQQIPEPNNTLPGEDLRDATLRQIVRVSTGGPRLRVRLSNAFGTQALVVDAAHVAMAQAPDGAAIRPGSDHPLTFDGQPSVIIPAGATYLSDPVAMAVPALASLAVSIHLPEAPAQETGHPGSRATSYYVHGNRVGAPALDGAKTVDHWYELAGVDVATQAPPRAVVTLGDSITDGHGATTNGNDRWPDRLAERLQAAPALRSIGVLNHGIGGNRLLADGLGPSALARFERDVLAQPGAHWVIVLEGVNDLGGLSRADTSTPEDHATLVHRIIGAYHQMIERAHAHGITAIGGTITPFGQSDYYHATPAIEADRAAINAWIRAPGHFDSVVDFDRALADPADPHRMRADYNSGDGLHPSPAGYKAMADAIPLTLFR